MRSKEIFTFGYSGHAYVVLDTLLKKQFLIKGYFDFSKATKNPYDLDYLGFEGSINIHDFVKGEFVFPSIGENALRKKLVGYFEEFHLNQTTIIDPSANVSEKTHIMESSFIGKNVSINALAEIGKGVIINTAAVIEHECKIGGYCHIAPNATLAGNVTLNENVFIGAGAVIKQGITIGSNAIIGAGSVVISNIPTGEVWAGCPAKKIRNV